MPSNKMQEKVELVLAQYQQGIDNFNTGWDVLRYAKQDLININSPEFDADYAAWMPGNPDHVTLRLAKAGKLSYQSTN